MRVYVGTHLFGLPTGVSSVVDPRLGLAIFLLHPRAPSLFQQYRRPENPEPNDGLSMTQHRQKTRSPALFLFNQSPTLRVHCPSTSLEWRQLALQETFFARRQFKPDGLSIPQRVSILVWHASSERGDGLCQPLTTTRNIVSSDRVLTEFVWVTRMRNRRRAVSTTDDDTKCRPVSRTD